MRLDSTTTTTNYNSCVHAGKLFKANNDDNRSIHNQDMAMTIQCA